MAWRDSPFLYSISDSVFGTLVNATRDGAGQNPAREVPLFHRLELLDSPAPVCLGHINTAFGINCQNVAIGKCTDLGTRTPEPQENLPAGMVENLDLLVAAVVYVHVFCSRREKSRSTMSCPNYPEGRFLFSSN